MTSPTDTPYWVVNKTSRALWEAYLRIMEGKPKRVKPTARMTLSSVATEAGFQRSTLSKKRYPDLAELIEKTANKKPGQSITKMYERKAEANRNLRHKLEAEKAERDALLSQLAFLESRHLQMAAELERMATQHGGPKVVRFDPTKQKV